jgi:hypothetical protein
MFDFFQGWPWQRWLDIRNRSHISENTFHALCSLVGDKWGQHGDVAFYAIGGYRHKHHPERIVTFGLVPQLEFQIIELYNWIVAPQLFLLLTTPTLFHTLWITRTMCESLSRSGQPNSFPVRPSPLLIYIIKFEIDRIASANGNQARW